MSKHYYTVKKHIENEYIVQKSKFISHVMRVQDEEEAQAQIQAISKAHWKANHNCYAYVIGDTSHIQKASDNGEPSGTAGAPILEVLKKQELRDTLVVVTRYFGGIKLGAGGLIRAYSTATSLGIKAAGTIERLPVSIYKVSFDYSFWGTVENHLKQTSYILRETSYAANVTVELGIRENDVSGFEPWIQNLCNGQVVIEWIQDAFIEVDVKEHENAD